MNEPSADEEATARFLDELDRRTHREKVEHVRDELAEASVSAENASLSNALDPLVRMIGGAVSRFDAFSGSERPDLDRLALKVRVLTRLGELRVDLGARPGLESRMLSLMQLLTHPIDRETRDLVAGREPTPDVDDVVELLDEVEDASAEDADLAERLQGWDTRIRRLDGGPGPGSGAE